MAAEPRNEFNLIAVPGQAMARRLTNLAADGMAPAGTIQQILKEEERRRIRRAADGVDAAPMELVASVYRETQMRLLTSFAIDGHAGKLALSEIERQLLGLARQRAEDITKAPKTRRRPRRLPQ